MLYVVELHNDTMGLVAARSLASARKEATQEQGSRNVKTVRHATAEDVQWVRNMGGKVPFDRYARKTGRLLVKK